MAAVATRVDAQISGTVSGQIAVGNHIIQNNVDHGGVVYIAAPGETPTPRPRPLPVVLRGRRAPDLLGREREVEAALDALGDANPIEFVGPPGSGKTTLLKFLTHAAPESSAVDGVVYHDAHGEAVEDTLQFLYEAFYETTVPFKPTEAQLQHALRDIRALVVLDDVEADRSGVAQILDSLPAANSILGSPRRSLWGGGCRSVPLRGLRRDAAVELLTRELGRDLTDRERAVATVIADAVGGHPLQLLRAAALVTELGYELAELADDLGRGSAPDELGRLVLASLDDEQRRILEVLAVLGGATLPADQLADLIGVDDAGPILESLMRLGLVQAHSPRYSTAGVVESLSPGARDAATEKEARAHLTRWLEARRFDPQAVVREVQAVLAVLRNAARDQEWADVLRLGRAAEGPLLLTGRWGAWREVVEQELVAARRLGDRAAEGWALHQLGSRALCLGERAGAISALRGALRIREQLADQRGAEVTRHNLDLLLGSQHTRPSGWKPGWVPGAGVAAVPGVGLPIVLPLLLLLAVLGLVTGAYWVTTPGPLAQSEPLGNPLTASPASIQFPDQATGTISVPRTASVSNRGPSDVMVRDISIVGGGSGSFRIDRDGCAPVPLAPGRSCPISVVFAPTRAGVHEASLTFAAEGFEPSSVTMRGASPASVAGGELLVQPTTLDFGSVALPSRSTRSLSVANAGVGEVPIGAMAISGANRADFSISRNGCPATLAPRSQCSVDITFSPSEATTRVAAVSIRAADTGETQGSVLIGRASGPVVPPPPSARTVIGLQVPASRSVPYGTVLDLTATATSTATAAPRLVAFGLPSGLDFVDNGNGTGSFRGTVLADPGAAPAEITVAATGGPEPVVERKRFTLTVVPAEVTLRWDQPLLKVEPGSVVSAQAILTRVGGTQGDVTRALATFDVRPCAAFSRGPAAFDASGRAVFRADDLPIGAQTVRAGLASSRFFRVVSAQPLTVVVVPDALSLTETVLADFIASASILPCVPLFSNGA